MYIFICNAIGYAISTARSFAAIGLRGKLIWVGGKTKCLTLLGVRQKCKTFTRSVFRVAEDDARRVEIEPRDRRSKTKWPWPLTS